jgi:regulator of sigma E protease
LFGKRFGETLYAFNALPIGGYVKIYGEDPTQVEDKDRVRSFVAKPRIIQAAVIVAGVVMNILLGWLLLSLALMMGIPAGVEEHARYELSDVRLYVLEARADSPAERAGLVPGDQVLSVRSLLTGDVLSDPTPDSFSAFVAPRAGEPLAIQLDGAGGTREIPIVPENGIVPDRAAIGISMDEAGILRLSPTQAFVEGAVRTWEFLLLIIMGIVDMIGKVFGEGAALEGVTGPVGIVGIVGDALGIGIGNFLMFAAIISLNLAVINLLPFPALDGGRLLFVGIEALTRRSIPARIQSYANIAGFALLMLLMVVITYRDVSNLL